MDDVKEWIDQGIALIERWHLIPAFKALLLFLVGFVAARVGARIALHLAGERLTVHGKALLRRGVIYAILALFLVSAFHQLGFNLTVLLGAAGVLSVAIGFASQTSASNLISGLFLLGERPFSVGDVVKVGDTTGEVISIDLLSVKLRTFDNLFVRIPNETLIKSQVTTLTRFPIRRYDMKVGVAYREEIGRVKDVLMRVADRNPLCLDEPAPLFIFLGFGESSLDIQFSVWAKRENWLDMRNRMHEEVKEAFDAEGIEIPFPHRTLYPGSVADPFPVRMVEPKAVEAKTDAAEGTGAP